MSADPHSFDSAVVHASPPEESALAKRSDLTKSSDPAGQDDPDHLYRELEARVRELRPGEDVAPLERAYRFAAERHRGQKRVSGEPYMMHPVSVTRLLAD